MLRYSLSIPKDYRNVEVQILIILLYITHDLPAKTHLF